jgi:hypothetical protein
MIGRSVLCCCIVGAIVLPAGASAATPAGSGTSVLTLQTAALGVQGVTISAVAPAKGSKFTFPVRTASVGKAAATLGHSGGLRLRAGTRSVTLSAPQVRLAEDSRLTAKIGKATVTVLTVDGAKRKLNATTGSVALRGAKVRLTVAGAAALRRALKVKRLSPGALGTLTVEAKRGTTTTTGTPTTTAPAGGTTPAATPTTPGTGTPTIDLGGPAPLARPATAVNVNAAGITWRVRESFIRYINTGEGTATSRGATSEPPTVLPGSSEPLVYDFHFPFKEGWYDPVSKTARVTSTGTVTFDYSAHGIKLTAADPEIEIAGGASRAIFVTANATPAKRGILVKLDPAAAMSTTHSPDGTAHAYAQIPGAIPADAGASVFAGFYVANDPFGWISVDFTTPPAP